MANQKSLSSMSLKALEFLQEGEFTANELKDKGLENLNSAHLTALVNRGLIESEKVVVEVPTIVKRKVNQYRLTEKGANFKG
jgi:DNA-binding PadR family transcriptional regulator